MKSLLAILSLLFTLNGTSQYDINDVKEDSTESNFNWFETKQRIYVGGELGLSFGSGSSYIHIAPLIGYDITPKFSAGISAMYQLWRFKDYYGTANYNTFGGGVFTRFRPIEQVILQAEFDLFNTVDFAELTYDRVNVPALMAGIGYANSFGDGAYYQIMLMYDFINNPNMPLPGVILQPLHLKMGIIWHLS